MWVILPSIYLIDSIGPKQLHHLVQYATGHERKLADIATRSALSKLIKNNYVIKTTEGYQITLLGIERIRASINAANLDVARIAIMNSQHRKNTMLQAIGF